MEGQAGWRAPGEVACGVGGAAASPGSVVVGQLAARLSEVERLLHFRQPLHHSLSILQLLHARLGSRYQHRRRHARSADHAAGQR